MDAKRGRGGDGSDSGTRNDDEVDEFREALRIAPRGESGDVVGADEPREMRVRVASVELLGGVDAVRDAAATEFEVVDGDLGHTGECEAQHSQTERITGGDVGRFERGLSCRDDDESIQLALFEGCVGDEQVPEVDGVEGPSIKSEAGHAVDQGSSGRRRTVTRGGR